MPTPTTRAALRVLLVGGKDSGFRSISEMDVDVTLLQTREDVTALQIDRAVELFVCEPFDEATVTRVAQELHRQREIAAVLSFDERHLALAAHVGELLGVAHNPLAAVRRTRDKLAMRRCAELRGLPGVRYAQCFDPDAVRAFLTRVAAPAVLKPATGSGSRGVALLDSPAAVDEAWRRTVAAEGPPAIVEEYVEGREFSVETLTLDGAHTVVAITEKQTTGAPSFVETGHQLPARLPEVDAAAMRRVVTDLLDAVGHRWGPAHTEVMLNPRRGPVIIETHTRFGGDQIWEMVELVTGTRLAGATVAGMLGVGGAAWVAPVAEAAAIRYFTHQHATVVGVSGVAAARTVPGVVRVTVSAVPGQVLGPLAGSRSRQGYVLAVGDDVEQAVRRAEEAHAAVVFALRHHEPAGGRRDGADLTAAYR